jgi:uncharacterized protein (TIGR00255 family)
MTGFAQVKRSTALGELTLSLRSVNHRGLDLHFYYSSEFLPFENALRGLLKEEIGRGHVEIRATLARSNGTSAVLNRETLKSYAETFRSAATELGLSTRPDLNALLTLPGVVTQQADDREQLNGSFEAELLPAMRECVEIFNGSRDREGEKLAEAMTDELRGLEHATSEIKGLRDGVLPALRERLEEKLRELLGGSGIPESRIVEETAILVDRSDVQEELTRLTVHGGELRRILDGGGAVGKQIDFLLQEMNRETNTTLAKSSNSGDAGLRITALALGIKANIERIREQALNLE